MNKKNMMIVAGIIAFIVIGGIGLFLMMKKDAPSSQPAEATKKKKVTEPANLIPVTERPYIKIVPLADGRNLNLVVEYLPKSATQMEYELEYQAGSLLQGAFGLLDLNTLPSSTKVLLGSCSAGGSCTYHEDVKGGTLVGKFTGPQNYVLKQDWRYFDNTSKETAFSSKDAKFQIESKDLASQRFLVIYNAPGYPANLAGTPVSEPYSLTTSAPLAGKAELKMRANEEGAMSIQGWNGSGWKKFETKVEGKDARATVELMELYILTK